MTTAGVLGNHQRNLQRTLSREVMTYMLWRLMDRCFLLAFLYGYTRYSYDQNAALTLLFCHIIQMLKSAGFRDVIAEDRTDQVSL